MKKTIGILGGIVLSLFSASLNAQQTTWDPSKNPTVDSLTSPYKGKLLPARPALTTTDFFPVIGKYVSTTNADAASVMIVPDEQYKGVVWIEGLPQGKIKAMLRKSPATYKIPAQKTGDGKDVPEGTLIFDKVAGTLSICIGKTYNAENPSAAFTPVPEEPTPVADKGKTAKTKAPDKSKPWIYAGTKVDKATVMN